MNKEQKIEILTTYHNLMEQKKAIEVKFEELKATIKTDIGSGEFGDFIVIVEDRERQSFDWKKAKSEVTEAVWAKISRFLKITSYEQLKVVQK
jgi:hypothetical protein